MSDDTDASREYERLRAELAEFVLKAMSEHVAAGQQPQLSQALIDAIDRRVDEAVATRLAEVQWPDPDAFADSVVAAAAARGGGGSERIEPIRRRSPVRREAEPAPRRITPRMIIGGLIGIALVAAATFLLLRGWNGPTNTVVMNAQTQQPETPPETQNMLPPISNEIVPPANVQSPGR